MEFTTASRWLPDSRTRPTYSFCLGSEKPPTIPCSNMSEKPMMEFSGVRNSWLTAASMRLLVSLSAFRGVGRRRECCAQRCHFVVRAQKCGDLIAAGRRPHHLDDEGTVVGGNRARRSGNPDPRLDATGNRPSREGRPARKDRPRGRRHVTGRTSPSTGEVRARARGFCATAATHRLLRRRRPCAARRHRRSPPASGCSSDALSLLSSSHAAIRGTTKAR